MKVKSESEVAQSCPTPSNPKDCSLPGSPPSMGFSRKEYWNGLPLLSLIQSPLSERVSEVAQSCLTLRPHAL